MAQGGMPSIDARQTTIDRIRNSRVSTVIDADIRELSVAAKECGASVPRTKSSRSRKRRFSHQCGNDMGERRLAPKSRNEGGH